MITSEELENFDIFPKEYSFSCLFKFIFYSTTSLIGFIVLFAFYTDSDLSSILTFNFRNANKYYANINDYLTNQISILHPKNFYSLNQSTFVKYYSEDFEQKFYKEYLLDGFPCLIKNSSDAFNITNITNFIQDKLLENNKTKITPEIRDDPFSEFFKKDFKYYTTTYTDLFNKNVSSLIKGNYFINDLDINTVIEKGKNVIQNNFLQNNKILKEMEIREISYNEVKKFVVVSGHYEISNQFLCINEGEIDLLLVPPQDKRYVYPFNKYGPINYSRVNFFYGGKETHDKFPDFSKASKIFINLMKGECVFIPAFWWVSLKTVKSSNFNQYIILKYKSNSQYLEQMMNI